MNIQEFFALSENGQNWTAAFNTAFKKLRDQGGGKLVVPPGEYFTGSIQMFSHTTIEVQNGAVLRFLQREDAYPLVDLEFEGASGKMHRPCIYAEYSQFVTVTGEGTIDGQGAYWWEKVRAGHLEYPRPRLVCFFHCEHVTVEKVTLTNSPCWTLHPLHCHDVVARNLRILNPSDSPNTDGIDPDSCKDVRIFDCTIDVGDDCIAIKAGTEHSPQKDSCERIIISNCHFLHGHGGIVIGSEMSGNVRNVIVSNCVFSETDRGLRIKTRRGRGGIIENLQFTDLIMEKVMCPFVFHMYYFCGAEGKRPLVSDKNPHPVDLSTPILRNVSINRVRAQKCTACAGYFYGLSEMPIQQISMHDVIVEMDESGSPGFPAMMEGCPEMHAAGFYLRNVRDFDLSSVKAIGVKGAEFDYDSSVGVN